MPLRVWLPLLGNTNNQGMSENIFTVSNSIYITVDNAGKLGQCYKFNSTESNNGIHSPDNGFMDKYINNHSFSLCAWVNIASDVLSTPVICLSYGLRLIVGNTSAARLNLYNSTLGQINCMSSVALNDGKWHHFVGTYDVNTNKMAVYVDGVNTGTATYPSGPYASSWRNGLYIGRDPNSAATTVTDSALFRGKMQDIRIYDHALSPKQINEIAKGLVCHYPLNNPNVTDNLFLNGFGQDGLLGWSNSNYSTTEIPPNQPTIKASYINSNTTLSYIPISHDTTYTISEYIKAISGSTGNTYPSLLPYDIDKKFIGNNNCLDGFNSTYKTTLSQPLKKGDTVIHATDLSAWTTATTNHYYYVAIFGYKDSTGHVYADMTYTADSPSFGSMTDKSNIDKTNNTVTLLSAYTGEDRPAGTTICQATAGSGYVYPYGGIAVSTISDWTFKTTTVNPSAHNRLKWARYVRYLAYPSAYHAGIKLVDNNADKIVYDSSGFSNNSKAVNNIFPSSDTPRNTISTRFVDNTSTVTITPCFSAGQTLTELSVSIWYRTNTLNSTAPNLWSLGENNFARIRIANATSLWYYIRVGSTQVGAAFAAGKTLTDDTWHHVVLTFKDGVVVMYLDGNQIGTTDHSATATYLTCNSVGTTWHLGGYTATAEKFIGSLSDFRLYTTCLSADAVKQLYNTPVSIANNGSMLIQGEFVEL